MSIFNDIIKIWKSDSLLSQAWDDSIAMLKLSNEIFLKSLESFNSPESLKEIKALKKEDRKINDYQMTVRRKVLTHFSIGASAREVTNGLVLVDMVVDIERIGDYCKNISDLTLMKESSINFGELSNEISKIEEEVKSRFSSTIEVIENQDEDLGFTLQDKYRKAISTVSDNIVSDIVSGKTKLGSQSKSAALVLYVRYLKRIGAHLKNITSTVVNAYDRIGYER